MPKKNSQASKDLVQQERAHRETADRLARRALFGFVVTFLIARVAVFLIMSGQVPNMYFFMQGTHVHHLNYGIFLLSVVAGVSIFKRPLGRQAEIAALIYGISLALTFDEFGMWLHLGGSYWQRASVDAVIVIASLIGLVGYARSIKRFESHHLWSFLILAFLLLLFGLALFSAGNKIGTIEGPKLEELEASSSP
jgi:hypothetical protein